jgi:hypothetical protein
VATGEPAPLYRVRRHPSLHMDVRFLACPGDGYTTLSPQRTSNIFETRTF